MKRRKNKGFLGFAALIVLLFLFNRISFCADFAVNDNWHSNPLGFEPLNLHTKNGFLIPALAVGICLLATKQDNNRTDFFTYYTEGGVYKGYKYPNTMLIQSDWGANVMLRNWMSVGLDFDLYLPYDKFNKTTGIAAFPFARFYPINSKRFKLYFESGGGLVYFFSQFPRSTDQDSRTGTTLNGTTKYGIGSAIKINKTTLLMLGLRHVHVSNGNAKGVERNPSHDSNGGYIGLSFTDFVKIIH